jgi:hypothetical protein
VPGNGILGSTLRNRDQASILKPLIEWRSFWTRRQDVRHYRLEGIRIIGKPIRDGCEDDRF